MRAISLLFHDVYVDHPDESGFTSEAANRYKLALSDFDAQLAGVDGVRSDSPILAIAMARLDDDAARPITPGSRSASRGWAGEAIVSSQRTASDAAGFCTANRFANWPSAVT
jgi:hypothetical protein